MLPYCSSFMHKVYEFTGVDWYVHLNHQMYGSLDFIHTTPIAIATYSCIGCAVDFGFYNIFVGKSYHIVLHA
jgi:hypothetical protein